MPIPNLRRLAINEEIDYLFLKSALAGYAHPRDKITALLKNKVIVRVKKGLYVFGSDYAQSPYSKETLANLIYGPSYISLEYALAFYGMIPERVEIVTSVTNKRDKVFNTPVGRFTYKYQHSNKYPMGITQHYQDKTHPILIASPEKAIVDQLSLNNTANPVKNLIDLETYLLDNLRLDEQALWQLDRQELQFIAKYCKNTQVDLLIQLINRKHA